MYALLCGLLLENEVQRVQRVLEHMSVRATRSMEIFHFLCQIRRYLFAVSFAQPALHVTLRSLQPLIPEIIFLSAWVALMCDDPCRTLCLYKDFEADRISAIFARVSACQSSLFRKTDEGIDFRHAIQAIECISL